MAKRTQAHTHTHRERKRMRERKRTREREQSPQFNSIHFAGGFDGFCLLYSHVDGSKWMQQLEE